MKTSLILVPHPDDDVLSFGGYMIDEIAKGNRIVLAVFAVGGPYSNVPQHTRVKEFEDVMNYIGVKDYNIISYNTDGILGESWSQAKLTTAIDALIDRCKPDIVLTTYPSTHQDHLALHAAFQSSMRLRSGFMPKTVALGEYPFILSSYDSPNGGKWYHPLSKDTFDKKCKAFELYASQSKPSPSPLGLDGIEILAKTRGLECGNTYAELYYIQKLVQ